MRQTISSALLLTVALAADFTGSDADFKAATKTQTSDWTGRANTSTLGGLKGKMSFLWLASGESVLSVEMELSGSSTFYATGTTHLVYF